MTRSQILLEAWQQRFLADTARRTGKSISAVIRQWIEEKACSKPDRRSDPLFRLVGMVEDSASDVSEDPDAYLYGRKSRRRR